MPHESFDSPQAESRLFGPDAVAVNVRPWAGYGEGGEGTAMHDSPASLSAEEEELLFLRYNYARLRLARTIADADAAPGDRARGMVRWQRQAMAVRADIVHANLALVVAMAGRSRYPSVEFADLVAEGNMALLRSIEAFDVSRGFRFSTYACRCIVKSFHRLATNTRQYRVRFGAELDENAERPDFEQSDRVERAETEQVVREAVSGDTGRLDELEQMVLRERFGLNADGRRWTLAALGKRMGMSHERVRRIQKRAIGKIRVTLGQALRAG